MVVVHLRGSRVAPIHIHTTLWIVVVHLVGSRATPKHQHTTLWNVDGGGPLDG